MKRFSTLKNVILYLSFILVLISNYNISQTTFSWRNDQNPTSGQWNVSNYWWNGSSAQLPTGSEILFLDGNVGTSMTNDLPSTNRFKIIFGNSSAASRTINGSTTNTFYEFGATWPRIQNDATNILHTLNFPINASTNSGFNLELVANLGPLTFSNTINNNGRTIQIYGNNSSIDANNRFIRLSGVLSGAGTLNISQFGTVKLNANHTYTGQTQIDNGELWIESSGAIAAASGIFVGNGGQLANVAKIWLQNSTGGTTFSNNLTINDGNATTRYLGGLNTSGNHTFSGNITNNSTTGGLNLSALNSGGTTTFSGVISGAGNIYTEGSGLVVFSGSSNNTFTGSLTVSNGTLVLNKSAGIKAIPQLPAALFINNGATLRTDADNQFGTAAMPALVTINGNAVFNGNNTNQKISVVSASSTSSITMGTGTLTIDNTSVDTYAGTITGSGGLTKSNTGTQIFTNTGVNYTGNTTITQGIIQLGASNVIPNSSPIILNGGTFSSGSASGFSETMSTLSLTANSNLALGTGAHNINFANSSGATWTANTFLTITGWTGGYNGTAGTGGKIFFGSDATGLTPEQLAQIYFVNGGNYYSASILSTGEIVPKNQAMFWGGTAAQNWATGALWSLVPGGPYTSTWISGSSAYFLVPSSTITIQTTQPVCSGINAFENVTVTYAGSTFSTGATIAPIYVASSKTFDFSNTAMATAAGTGFIKNGNGTIISSNGNAYPGGFTMNKGLFGVGGVNALGNGGSLNINGGTLGTTGARNITTRYSSINIGGDFTIGATGYSSTFTFADNVTLGNNATRTITLGAASIQTLNGIISGTNSNLVLNATAAGTLSLGGVNTYGGNTTINGGTLSATVNGALPSTTNITLANTAGAVLNIAASPTVASISGGGTTGGNITLSSGRLTINQASNTTYSGVISGAGGLTKTGSGILTLSNSANTYTGSSIITNGELRLNPTANASLASQMDLNGGKLSTSNIVATRTITNSSTLKLSASSSIDLGSNAHTLSFAASNGVTWTAAQTLTINGWTGTEGSSGTAGRIFVGNAATHLTATQLAQINFTGYANGAMLLSTGELVPILVVCTVAPTSLLVSTATICNGNSTTITQSGGTLGTGATWRWYSDAGFTTLIGSSVSANASLSVSPAISTTYYLRAEGNSSPCSSNLAAPGSVSITVNQPTIAPSSISGTATICNGSSTTLTQTGGTLGTGATWKWYSDAGFTILVGSNSNANASISVSPTSTTTYYLRAEGTSSPCTGNVAAPGSVTVTVLPVVNYGNVDQGHVVISQVYGGGGLSGATYRNDFVELYNPTNVSVSLATFSIQYANTTGTSWSKQNLTGSIAPKSYYLIQLFSSGANGSVLPTPDNTGTIDMANGAGKIALISNQTTLGAVSCPSSVIDYVGYGSGTNCSETSPTGNPSATTAAIRKDNGCTETNNNAADFTITTPSPKNSSLGTNTCGSQNFCATGTPNPMSVTASTGSSSFSYQWYFQNGIVAAPSGTSTVGWTSLGSSDGANTNLYSPSSAITSSRTYACFVTPTGSPACGTGTWATGAKQVTVNQLPTASAGGTISAFVGEYLTVSGASAANGTILWTQNGTGYFDETYFPVNNDETTTPTYYTEEGDFGQTVLLTMTVTGLGACSASTASAIYTINVDGRPAIWTYQCGTTLADINDYVYAYAYPSATQYRFRIFDGTTTQTFDTPASVFYFTQFPSYLYNTTYTVDVCCFVSGSWTAYGPTCSITTPNLPVTQIQSSQCGVTLATMNSEIYADLVMGATQYRFRVTQAGNTQIFDNPSRLFYLTQYSGYDYNLPYTIDVAVFYDGTWQIYGSTCTINSPNLPLTNIIASQCGITVSNLDVDLYANEVAGATQYRFRATNGSAITIDKPSRTFKFSQMSGILAGTTYSVDVAAYVNGVWGSYGSACNISTPAAATTQLIPSQCGITLTDIFTDLYSNAVTGATQYRFRVVNSKGTQTIIKPSRTFKLSQVSNVDYGGINTIDVDVFVGGAWIGYGPTCSVTSPAIQSTKIMTAQCGTTASSIYNYFYANEVPGATQYRFRIDGVQTIIRTSRLFQMSQISGLAINTTYSVDVDVYYNGAWQGYGTTCNITSPAVLAIMQNDAVAIENENEIVNQEALTITENNEDIIFTTFVFPNPFKEQFEIYFESGNDDKMNLIVFDAAGKEIENYSITKTELQNMTFGEKYQSGLYFVHVKQQNKNKILKVIKE